MPLEIRIAVHQDLQILNNLYTEIDQEPPLPLLEVEEIFRQIQQIPNYNIYIA